MFNATCTPGTNPGDVTLTLYVTVPAPVNVLVNFNGSSTSYVQFGQVSVSSNKPAPNSASSGASAYGIEDDLITAAGSTQPTYLHMASVVNAQAPKRCDVAGYEL
jgi:hypothetical protein